MLSISCVLSCLRVLMPCGRSTEGKWLLALVCDVYCDCVTFPFVILGRVWYLFVSIPDRCCLSYNDNLVFLMRKVSSQFKLTFGLNFKESGHMFCPPSQV